MKPRVAITGIGVVSPFGVGREVFWTHISSGASGTRAITDFDASGLSCRVSAAVPDEMLAAADVLHANGNGEGPAPTNGRADPRHYAKVSRTRRDRGARGVPRRGPRAGQHGCRRDRRQRRRRHRRRRAPVRRVLQRRVPQGVALRHSRVDRGHRVERDLDRARAARHEPRAVDRLHELDRRDRLRRRADPPRAKRTCCSPAAPMRARRRA